MRALAIQANVSDETAVRAMFKKVHDEFGRLDIVVSNAGIEFFGELGAVAGEDIDRVFAVNVKGQYFVAQEASKYMAEYGRVMLTSSISAVKVGGYLLFSSVFSRVPFCSRCINPRLVNSD